MEMIALIGKHGKGKFTLIDDEDFEYLNQFHWHLIPNGYVRRSIRTNGKTDHILMHREILKILHLKDLQVDHISGNKLDNQKNNIRSCTASQNQWSSRSFVGVSQYKGVVFMKIKKSRQWQAQINFNNKRIYLGQYETEEEAAYVYDRAALEYHGEFALTNFPKENYI